MVTGTEYCPIDLLGRDWNRHEDARGQERRQKRTAKIEHENENRWSRQGVARGRDLGSPSTREDRGRGLEDESRDEQDKAGMKTRFESEADVGEKTRDDEDESARRRRQEREAKTTERGWQLWPRLLS